MLFLGLLFCRLHFRFVAKNKRHRDSTLVFKRYPNLNAQIIYWQKIGDIDEVKFSKVLIDSSICYANLDNTIILSSHFALEFAFFLKMPEIL